MSKSKNPKERKEKPRLWKGANPVAEMYHDWQISTQKISEVLERWIKDEISEKRFIFEMIIELKELQAKRQEYYAGLANYCVPGVPETDPDFPG